MSLPSSLPLDSMTQLMCLVEVLHFLVQAPWLKLLNAIASVANDVCKFLQLHLANVLGELQGRLLYFVQ